MFKYIFVCSLFFTITTHAQIGSFSFTLAAPATTSAGVYSKDGILIRTLWSAKKMAKGTYTKQWNGKDDVGEMVKGDAKDFEIKLLTNNVKYEWQGTIGNTSDSAFGLSKHRGYYHCMQSLAFSGNFGYFCTGYSEGSPSLARFNIATPNQKKQFFASRTQSGDINFVAADANTIYWGAYDANTPKNSFVFATIAGSDDEVKFSEGKPYIVKYGKTYNNSISIINDPAGHISGLAVQQKGRFLFVSREGTNELQVLDKRTGELVSTQKIDAPRSVCVDKNDNLWMVTGANKVRRYIVKDNGSIEETSTSLQGLEDPVAMQASPKQNTIAVADGGSSQQVKFYNAETGKLINVLGEANGYFADATVTDDKFYFNDSIGRRQTFIAYEPNGSFWVGDPGNFRVQHYSASNTFVNRIMSLGATYSTWVDKNNIKRVWASYLEFEVDYRKPITGKTGWKLVKNWGANITKAFDKSELFRYILTLKNGRTYGFLRKKVMREVVEFPAKGQLRFSGNVPLMGLNFVMAKDGSLQQYIDGPLGGVSTLYRYELMDFDNNGDPVWSKQSTVLSTTPRLTTDDPNATPRYECLTSSGLVINYDYDAVQTYEKNNVPKTFLTGHHLGAIKQGGNTWLWKTELATNRTYKGGYPGAGFFDIGNGVNNNAGGSLCIVDRNIITSYHGEFWKNGQTNKFNHYWDDGLAVNQFGITRAETTDHATAMMAGNALTPIMVKDEAGNLFIYHGDESDHAGVHRWKITGLNTIKEQTVPLTKVTSLARKTSSNTIDLMESLPYDQTLTNSNATGWSRNPENDISISNYNNIFTAATNVLSYDRMEDPDLFLKFAQPVPATFTVNRELGKNNCSQSWTLSGMLAFPVNMPNGFSTAQFLEVLDDKGKTIVSFYSNMDRQKQPFQAYVFGNYQLLLAGKDNEIKKQMEPFNNFEVKVVQGKVSFQYANSKVAATKVYDPSANWRTPATLRIRFESTNNGNIYGVTIGLKDFMFTAE